MESAYDKLVNMIKMLDIEDDGIVQNQKVKSIERDFCEIVLDEQMLSESMQYINNEVLKDNDASQKFAYLFSSRAFDSLAMNNTKVRHEMINILQHNFINAQKYREMDNDIFYNSITLLGEYYNRVRLSNHLPIDILGESLLELLIEEINSENKIMNPIEAKLAKLILSQVTLNGALLRANHKAELHTLLFFIRKNLIETPTLEAKVKAFLLMTLDLYYSDFNSLDEKVEGMYTKYLIEESPNHAVTEVQNSFSGDVKESTNESDDSNNFKWSEEVSNAFDNQGVESSVQHENENYNNYCTLNVRYEDDCGSVQSEGCMINHFDTYNKQRNSNRSRNFRTNRNSNWERKSRSSCDRDFSSSPNPNYCQSKSSGYIRDRVPRFIKNENWRFRGSENNLHLNVKEDVKEQFSKNVYNTYSRRRNSLHSNRNMSHSLVNIEISKSHPPNGRKTNKEYSEGKNLLSSNYQQSRNFSRSNCYGSQNSLNSEGGSLEIRGSGRRNFYPRKSRNVQNVTNYRDEDLWDNLSTNKEIIQNARNTADFINKLTKK